MVLSDSVLYISGTLKAKKKHLLSFSARGIKDRSKATSFAICPFCFPFTALRAGCGHGLGTQGWRDMLGSRCRIDLRKAPPPPYTSSRAQVTDRRKMESGRPRQWCSEYQPLDSAHPDISRRQNTHLLQLRKLRLRETG